MPNKGIHRDDALSVRLVLEELLTNISLHAQLPPHNDKVDLLLEVERAPSLHYPERRSRPRSVQGTMCVTLHDAGGPFNPLSHCRQHGLYKNTRGNRLCLVVPSNFGAEGGSVLPHQVKAPPQDLGQRLSERLCILSVWPG